MEFFPSFSWNMANHGMMADSPGELWHRRIANFKEKPLI